MSDLPDGLPESYFFQHADGRQVELLNFRRQPNYLLVAPGEAAPKKKRRRKVPGSFRFKRIQLRERDGNKCHYCKLEMIPTTNDEQLNRSLGPRMETIEHVVPFSNGGPNSLFNLVLACAECNSNFGSQHYKCYCNFCEAARAMPRHSKE